MPREFQIPIDGTLLSQFSLKVLVHRAATILVHMKYRLNQQSKSWKAYVLAQTWWLGFMLVYRMQLLIEWFQIYFWLHLEKREKINPNIDRGLVVVVLGMLLLTIVFILNSWPTSCALKFESEYLHFFFYFEVYLFSERFLSVFQFWKNLDFGIQLLPCLHQFPLAKKDVKL